MKSLRNVQEKRTASITEGLLHYLLEKEADKDFQGVRLSDVPNIVKSNQRVKRMFNDIIPNPDELDLVVGSLYSVFYIKETNGYYRTVGKPFYSLDRQYRWKSWCDLPSQEDSELPH